MLVFPPLLDRPVHPLLELDYRPPKLEENIVIPLPELDIERDEGRAAFLRRPLVCMPQRR